MYDGETYIYDIPRQAGLGYHRPSFPHVTILVICEYPSWHPYSHDPPTVNIQRGLISPFAMLSERIVHVEAGFTARKIQLNK